MNFTKKKIADMTKAYSVCPVEINGEQKFIVGTEKKGPIVLFDENGKMEETIWDGEGGVMSIVPIPNEEESFLTTYKFYSPNDGYDAKIVRFKKVNGKWDMKLICDLPFVHRFDLLKSGDEFYLIACTIKSGFEFKNDWNNPGKIYGCKLPKNLEEYNENNQLKLDIIAENLTKNHGYSKVINNGEEYAVVTSVEGVFKVYPPRKDKEWEVKKILDQSTSDAILYDLDNDGKDELVTFSEFHGDHLDIYKEVEKNNFEKVYSYKKPLRFLHALHVNNIDGKPVLFVGHRGGERDLFALKYENEKYVRYDIDSDVGVANVSSFYVNGKFILIAAHRETNQACIYTIE
ncbi:hypothetical protein HMPREF9709_01878 [Helcococcus kunzii ATCC 51366]|uniref:FG-GAP repeat protein n=1 Tax=Helcococcus kunzii ATCC 51366 TaxID=883114 RepID=H3NRB7_9FIRM|nr:hypothetical protein [Helcococcus kunzii]EHR31635.1 hypothetical protein HMPREF9709_01878 [Helcococcus kunzii ATCC 51366]